MITVVQQERVNNQSIAVFRYGNLPSIDIFFGPSIRRYGHKQSQKRRMESVQQSQTQKLHFPTEPEIET